MEQTTSGLLEAECLGVSWSEHLAAIREYKEWKLNRFGLDIFAEPTHKLPASLSPTVNTNIMTKVWSLPQNLPLKGLVFSHNVVILYSL